MFGVSHVYLSVWRSVNLQHLIPTDGGAIIDIVGANLGPSAQFVTVLWNGDPVTSLNVVVSSTTLRIASRAGQGTTVDLKVIVGGQVASIDWWPDRNTALQFEAPRIARMDIQASASNGLDCRYSIGFCSPVV